MNSASQQNSDALRGVAARHLRGLFTLPHHIAPTLKDVTWFAEHGRVFRKPTAHPTFQGQACECFKNACDAVWSDPSLQYVQGFVQTWWRRELILHAWCTNLSGELIEVTWDVRDATGGEVYFGVPLSLRQLVHLQLAVGTYDWYDGFADILDVGC